MKPLIDFESSQSRERFLDERDPIVYREPVACPAVLKFSFVNNKELSSSDARVCEVRGQQKVPDQAAAKISFCPRTSQATKSG
jgi:hypothetical protein